MSSAFRPASIRSETENESETTNSVCAAQPGRVAAATPAMRQYFEIKERYAECLVFYRMGDFYELFFDDAVKASAILDIALTKRGKHAGEEIPMCGVPVHAAELYLQKLIASGVHVAVCEQMETPEEAKKRGHKEVVRREVVRVATPGTITEEALLAPEQAQYIAAFTVKGDDAAVAWLELSTGEFRTSSGSLAHGLALLSRIAPREVLVSSSLWHAQADAPWMQEWRNLAAIRPDVQFDARKADRLLAEHYTVASSQVLGQYDPLQLSVCGALLEYVRLTQIDSVARLDAPSTESAEAHLQMDSATRRNLELVQTQSGQRRGSLLAAIDDSVTAAGSRMLCQWLSAPLRDLRAITARLDAVEWMLNHDSLRAQLRALLKLVPDMERAIGRLSLKRGGPRDLAVLLHGLQQAQKLRELLRLENLPAPLSEAAEQLSGHEKLVEHFGRALSENLPAYAKDGNFIRSNYRADLTEFRQLRDESKRVIAVMEQQLKKETDIASLKIKQNNVLGYFIEITQIHEKKVPPHFIHRQGLAGSLRYSTPELNDTARKIEEAGDRALKLEQLVFEELVAEALAASVGIIATARALALLDVTSALAEVARAGQWVRPALTADAVLEVKAGRHVVVEQALRREHKEFIANDCTMDRHAQLWLITGPNMGGKSTFLRQQAILLILAQMGSFVPASAALIGIADKLFCRVGAGDDLARGQSTFMVEMVETAGILHQATSQSLVVLDEIGRGTATYDGVSIAWAVAEHLHNQTQCRALFATHYHELTALAEQLPRLKNFHASAKEYKDQLIFLHTITEGFADKSYGIHVAALAGMPKPVLARAKQLLGTLESGHSLTENKAQSALPLFEYTAPAAAANKLTERLDSIDVDEITPREALDLLAELKGLANE